MMRSTSGGMAFSRTTAAVRSDVPAAIFVRIHAASNYGFVNDFIFIISKPEVLAQYATEM